MLMRITYLFFVLSCFCDFIRFRFRTSASDSMQYSLFVIGHVRCLTLSFDNYMECVQSLNN